MARTVRRDSVRYYRNMRTVQERRANVGFDRDSKVHGWGILSRGRRMGTKLPDPWDDFGYARDDRNRLVPRKNYRHEIRRLNRDYGKGGD